MDRWDKNIFFLKDRQDKYPFQCKTVTYRLGSPRPEHVPTSKVGGFLRVPFKDHVVWGFDSLERLEVFKRLYPGNIIGVVIGNN